MTFVIIETACAECSDGTEPLMLPGGGYDTLEEAKSAVESLGTRFHRVWGTHPNGGAYMSFSDGEVWIAPIEALTEKR